MKYVFDPEDEMLLVTDVYTDHEHELTKRKLLVYQKYVHRQVRNRLRHELLTYVRPEVEDSLTLEIYTQMSAARHSIASASPCDVPGGLLCTESNLEGKTGV